MYESCTNKSIFVVSYGIFSLKLGIKATLPLLGHYFLNRCSSDSSYSVGSRIGVSIPAADSTKKTASET